MQTHPHVRTDRVAVASVTGVLTAAMGFSMLQLFVLGALGPRIVPDLGMSSAMLGFTTTVGFGTAALLSPIAGRGWIYSAHDGASVPCSAWSRARSR